MREVAYPLDIAASILECQPRKIMTEWAKGTISVVLDFGPKPTEGKAVGYAPADISAPFTGNYFPEILLNPRMIPVWGVVDEHTGEQKLTLHVAAFTQDYSQSGFFSSARGANLLSRENSGVSGVQMISGENGQSDVMRVNSVKLYGYWVVPYAEFVRLKVQSSFALKPCSPEPSMVSVTAHFKPTRAHPLDEKSLRITESEMQVMRELLDNGSGRTKAKPATATGSKAHGGVERFAIERERILAAALYVKHHYPKDTGKTFKSHAQCIHDHAYLFWAGEGEVPPKPDSIAKILADATRTPSEWKILGGKSK